MKKKILIISAGDEGISALTLQEMKEKFGDDIVLITPKEAKEQGLKMEDFSNIPIMKITPHPTLLGLEKSGKEKRRQRREQERKYNKKRKK